MKRILAFLLAFLMAFSYCFAETPATPTDFEPDIEYVEIADDDFGFVEEITPRVFIEMSPDQEVYMYDEITLTAILMDFPDNHTIYWEYSHNCQDWFRIDGEHKSTYTFTITPENMNYWWRVCVVIEG